MEYVAGETLRDALRGGSGLAVAEGLRVIEGVSAALDAIHRRGIVHRDVKPANILLGADGAIKLADLGIASAADRTRITADGAVLGTFSYMAPEQLDGARPTAAVDVYALSAVAFEVLSGRKARLEANPFALAHAISTQPPPDLSEVWPQAPRAAVELLVRGMSREPSERPRSAGELAGRLRAALEPHATAAMPVPAGVSAPPGFSSARAPMSPGGSAPTPEAPGKSRRPSYENAAAAAVSVEQEKRRDGCGSAVLRDGRADTGPRPSPGSEPSAGRRGTPSPPVMTAGVGASSARRSGAAHAAAPDAAAKPSTDRRARERGLMPANAARTLVASHRGGRSRGRILGAASIALVAGAVVATVAVSGVGSPARTPSGASTNRRSSAVSGLSRTTARTSGALKAPAGRVAATGASGAPANSVAATGASGAPANSVAATGASSAPANSAAATGASSPSSQRPAHSVAAAGSSSAPTNSAAPTGASSPPAITSASSSANAPAGSPVSAVESFYGLAASHRYAEAWALADPTFRTQLDGYQSFQAGLADDRSITFDAARVLSRSSGDATVAVQTTSVRTDGTQHCVGTVDLVSGSAPGSWLLHLIHINCT